MTYVFLLLCFFCYFWCLACPSIFIWRTHRQSLKQLLLLVPVTTNRETHFFRCFGTLLYVDIKKWIYNTDGCANMMKWAASVHERGKNGEKESLSAVLHCTQQKPVMYMRQAVIWYTDPHKQNTKIEYWFTLILNTEFHVYVKNLPGRI